jgi:hypothetical protein
MSAEIKLAGAIAGLIAEKRALGYKYVCEERALARFDGSISAHSWNKNAFHGLRRHPTGSAPSWPPEDGFCLTTLTQASLTLQTARSLRPA